MSEKKEGRFSGPAGDDDYDGNSTAVGALVKHKICTMGKNRAECAGFCAVLTKKWRFSAASVGSSIPVGNTRAILATCFKLRRRAVFSKLLAASTPEDREAIKRGRRAGRILRQLAEVL